jgi:alpha-1,2-mannosyltransferase
VGLRRVSFASAFGVLLLAHAVAALYAPVGDCDETFNYYEPVHYLLFGFGQQTWEYSSTYALRSWLYVSLHAAPLWFVKQALSNKVALFYALRLVLVAFVAFAEALLLVAVARRFGDAVQRRTLVLLLASTATFVSSAAFVPSSFAMACVSIVVASWYNEWPRAAVAVALVSTALGWPFASACLLPVALDLLYTHGALRVIRWGACVTLALIVPMVLIDSAFYRRFVFPAANIVHYNVLDKETSSELYGVEPLSYYVLNLALNFNVAAVLFALTPLVIVGSSPTLGAMARSLWLLSPAYLWLVIMLPQPHKEERFLFVVYPLLCVAAAVSSVELTRRWRATRALELLGGVGFVVVSVLRSASLVANYAAPLTVWEQFSALPLDRATPINVCVGQEWHRFPASFFLPHANVSLRYVDSGFRGLLPKPFAPFPDGIHVAPTGMNRYNREERDRYVAIQDCNYLVDLSSALPTANGTTWTVVADAPFFERSHAVAGSALDRVSQLIFIPRLSSKHLRQRNYRLLKQTQ